MIEKKFKIALQTEDLKEVKYQDFYQCFEPDRDNDWLAARRGMMR